MDTLLTGFLWLFGLLLMAVCAKAVLFGFLLIVVS